MKKRSAAIYETVSSQIASRLFSSSRVWIWSVILLSSLVCTMVAWMHLHHKTILGMALSDLENIREARIDLGKGFLHVSLGGNLDSPFEESQGMALLKQAIDSFDREVESLRTVSLKDMERKEFRESMENFIQSLNAWKEEKNSNGAKTVALRIAFFRLESLANEIDGNIQKRLIKLTSGLDAQFVTTLTFAVIFLGVICLVVLWAGRVKDKFEAASEISEERFIKAMEASNDGLWDWDVKKNSIYYSPAQWRMLGYEQYDTEVSPEILESLLHPDDRNEILSLIQKCINGDDKGLTSEFRLRRVDGSWNWVLGRGKAVSHDSEGKASRIIVTTVDITERIADENEREKLHMQLNQARKIEAIGRLAGGVAHDFNNMLGIIIGYTDMALENPAVDARLLEELKEIRHAADRSADLTRQLLAFARRQTIAPKVLDLNMTLGSMLKMLGRLIGENIELIWLPADELWKINMDPSQIDQIVANLCVNARDAINGIGRITIETLNTTLNRDNPIFMNEYSTATEEFVSRDYVMLSVSDNGCGMDRETLNKIFEPFFTTKEEGKGTGLGLATVHGIVSQNSGLINVYSEPGRGTTIKIYLPKYTKELSSDIEQEESSPEPSHNSEIILIVEDEPGILSMASRMLDRHGYTVLTALSPAEAVEITTSLSGKLDLLITDVIMPEMNGLDLMKKLQSLYPDLKTLFMSGYTANVIAHHGVLDKEKNFIQKPFSMTDLTKKVRDVINSRNRVSS